MKILNSEENLTSLLEMVREREIIIISAFASGTEGVVDMLLDHGNSLELLVGTINSFSSPDFFDYCKRIENDNFSMFVDFGYQNSTHWKLFLIKPDTVIIGSANFTNTGLSLKRDTCVVLESKTLLDEYIKEMTKIKLSSNIVSCDSLHFDDALKKYRENHRRMQAGRVRSVQAENGNEWLTAEENQIIPVFIWDSRHTNATIEKAHKLLKNDSDNEPSSILRDFFTYECDEADIPYSQGDFVLCMSSRGAYADFYSFDRIIHENGLNYIYSYKQKRYTRPFKLSNEIKSEIKRRVAEWYKKEITEIGRAEIESIMKATNIVTNHTIL